ncbi:MAG: site-2 protease family protein [Bryobacteraceae bacterium]
MGTLVALLRFLLDMEGVALLVGSGYIAYRAGWLEHFLGIHLPGIEFREATLVLLQPAAVAAVAGPVAIAAAAGIRGQRPWARLAAILASMVNLVIFPPFGLAFGVFGLWICFLPETRKILETFPAEVHRPGSALPEAIASAVGTLSGVAVFMGIGYFCSGFLPPGSHSLSDWRTLLWLLAGAPLVEVAVHEFGHLALGLGVGMRFQSIGVGPVALHRKSDGWRIRLSASWDGGFAGARAGAASGEQQLRKNLVAFIAGGPLASLLLALACFAVVIGAIPLPAFQPYAAWLAAAAGADFVFNLIPARIRGFRTDGAWLFDLIRRGDRWRSVCAEFAAVTALEGGVLPRDWPQAHVQSLTGVPPQSRDFLRACYLAAVHYLDREDPISAEDHLRRAAASCRQNDVDVPAEISLLLAYLLARHHNLPVPAADLFEKAKTAGETSGPQQVMVLAAIAMAEGEWAHAACWVDETADTLRRAPASEAPLAAFELARLNDLAAEIERRAYSESPENKALGVNCSPSRDRVVYPSGTCRAISIP